MNRGKGQKAFSPTDFMPYLEKQEEKTAEEVTAAHLMALQARFSSLKGLGK